ncbi:transcriptional regulator [Pelagibacterium flavum]|uniref:Transcriptional regulator n=2 Tax=Pelagibacterium flavum TaxID=2984530 RepID=A0ABY6IU24_9HYPH|nr:metalloregulator ArsR/SmtB family transcription factor [Pelagibacterium sp. YIM 151497]UYQ74048.1 transcriptional regulator [Pelagibacterium sp. YIM 151497]
MHGEKTAAELGKALGTSGEAARQQLVRLSEEGLVESWSQSRGVGRPSQFWRLTGAGQARFPDTHAALTVELLGIVGDTFGHDVLSRIIDTREERTKSVYHAAMSGADTLGERVARLADLRSAEGYMADWEADGEGGYVLYENHCPICAAATACQNFCRAELAVFRDVLGPDASVERTDHIVMGARRCAYRISDIKA